MRITFTGTNDRFFQDGFFYAFPEFVTGVSRSPNYVWTDVSNGMEIRFTGTGVGEDARDGIPQSGTITRIEFLQDGVSQAVFSDFAWTGADFGPAIEAARDGDMSGLGALFNSVDEIVVDAASAQTGYDFETFFEAYTEYVMTPVTFTGSAFGDNFQGGFGDDFAAMGAAGGNLNDFDSTPGDDTIDMAGITGDEQIEVEFGNWNDPVVVTLSASDGRAVMGDHSLTLRNIDAAMTAGGLVLEMGLGSDTVSAAVPENGELYVFDNQGADSFDVDISAPNSMARLIFGFGRYYDVDPVQGVDIDVASGTIIDDSLGFGGSMAVTHAPAGEGGRLEIWGTLLDDRVIGSDADETFIPLAGDDTIVGGGGRDYVRYDFYDLEFYNADFIDGSLASGVVRGLRDGVSFTDSLTDIPAMGGSVGDDTLGGTAGGNYLFGSNGDDLIFGGGGNDELRGGNGQDSVYGGADDDLLYGFNGADLLGGGAGDDRLYGENGNDALFGAAGNDTLTGGDGADTLGGADGDDSLDGGAGNDELWTSLGNDTAMGGGGNDTIGGFDGDDSLDGGGGADEIWGATGSDDLAGGNGDDTLGGSLGNDTLSGGAGQDELWGSLGNDSLSGGADADTIGAGVGNDTLNGGDGIDQLYGGLGDDLVEGGAGNDDLYGAGGNDTLDGGAGNDLIFAGPGADVVRFYAGSGEDELQFFSAAEDRLELDDDLWTGTLSEADILSDFATQADDGAITLDFGGGNVLEITGVAAIADLESQIDIV